MSLFHTPTKDSAGAAIQKRAEPTASTRFAKSLVLISRKLARIPGRADLALIASRAGWRTFEGSWDSDNGSPMVAAFEAERVAIVLVGPVPKIDGTPIGELFLRQGFRVVVVTAGGEATADDDPCLWVRYAATLPTGKPPLPDASAARFGSFDPTAIAFALEPAP